MTELRIEMSSGRNGPSKDLNEIALANLRELIATDDELLPNWKSKLTAALKEGIPPDVSVLEELIVPEQRHDSAQET